MSDLDETFLVGVAGCLDVVAVEKDARPLPRLPRFGPLVTERLLFGDDLDVGKRHNNSKSNSNKR